MYLIKRETYKLKLIKLVLGKKLIDHFRRSKILIEQFIHKIHLQ